MHWEKSPPPGLARSRPYQGVRVRDPVKELLRRKRSLDPQGARTAPPAADVVAHNTQPAFTRGGVFEPQADGALQTCAGWRAAATTATTAGYLQTSWSPSEYSQQDAPAPGPASALSADVYMQTLGPSYTMLTYTHTPLLTSFGSLPVGPGSIPQMEFSDSGLTYLPWAQPITTIATMPNQVQFGPGSAAPPLVHMPLSMSLTTLISQLEAPAADHPQMLDPDLRGPSLEEDPGLEAEAPSLLDTLLEDEKGDGEEGDKDSYSSSLFISNA